MDYKSYQPSGSINIANFLLSLLIGGVLTVFLGYVYALIIVYLPFIYLNALVTLGFGYLLSYIAYYLIRIFHNRSPKSQIGLAVFLGISANYFQWVTYVLYALLGEPPSIMNYLYNLGMIIQPGSFFSIIYEINQVGLWEIFGFQFTGIPLLLVWIAEFAIILGIPLMNIYKIKPEPYSEKFGKWYPKFVLNEDFESFASAARMIDRLKENVVETVNSFNRGDGWKHSKVYIYFLEGENAHYLDIEKVLNTTSEGTNKTEITVLVEHFWISNADAKAILEKHPNKKVSFLGV